MEFYHQMQLKSMEVNNIAVINIVYCSFL